MANVGSMHGAPAAEHPMVHHAIDATTGPGWYDSSWDLRRGLEVHEGLPGDASLHEWLEHHVRN
ncbi:hypothetical protein [Piscinibacter sp.]|uniref:hypothetical protein n=1 Tax=Piscinibacter sp. TaxID=1903157 RepID=UPI002D7E385B|nr:hypothetical protein [Albitalea sp.]